MSILVTGANGQLGMCLRRATAGDSRFIFTDVVEAIGVPTTILDITDCGAVRRFVRDREVAAIVNCAAYTNVDKAESDEAAAELLNATAVAYLAEAMKSVDGLLVHISTDYVFGEERYNTPCREDQHGTPTGVYGRTKKHGEEAIASSGCRAVIIRTAWLYSEYGRNFVKTMLQLTAEKPALKVVVDQVGTPTYAQDLADVIGKVLEAPQEGVFHFSNEGVCSWYDFAKSIARYAGHTSCDIQPCTSDQYPSPVKRPAYSVFDKTKIKETFGISIPYWTDSLRVCLDRLSRLASSANNL